VSRSLGLLDPLSVAWEILPWSFVVDWFYPVGTFLDNLSIIPQLEGRFTQTLKQSHHSIVKVINPLYLGAFGDNVQFRFGRFPSFGLATVLPSFRPFDKAMSSRRIYNAIALAQQKFKVGESVRRLSD
jgi:hypothetical protein